MKIPKWIMKPVSIIPQGVYCHGEFKRTERGITAEVCPYWDVVNIDISDEEGEANEGEHDDISF